MLPHQCLREAVIILHVDLILIQWSQFAVFRLDLPQGNWIQRVFIRFMVASA
jgi:hypothetical protein